MREINGATRLLGLFGWPVEHSMSPIIQNAAIEKMGLNWVYVPLGVEPARLGEAMAGVRAINFVGVNVTVPHKQAVMKFLDRIDPSARAIGAVNTVRFTEAEAVGYNTDIHGYRRTVELEGAFAFEGKGVLQIGAGGAGRAMAAGAADARAGRLWLFDVDRKRAESMAGDMRELFPHTEFRVLGSPGEIPSAAAEADLIANATPLGMKADDDLPVPKGAIQAKHLVFDAVYVPSQTRLLSEAAAVGARTVSGVGMLTRQGARALEIRSGQTPDEQLMFDRIREKLGLD